MTVLWHEKPNIISVKCTEMVLLCTHDKKYRVSQTKFKVLSQVYNTIQVVEPIWLEKVLFWFETNKMQEKNVKFPHR
jgi:hypothetical protein